jgi:hypothetical protein
MYPCQELCYNNRMAIRGCSPLVLVGSIHVFALYWLWMSCCLELLWWFVPCHAVLLVYSQFGDGEGRGYTVCTSVNICQSNQWNSAARMLQNFHHTLYISDYNVSPMEICGTIVAEFSLFYYIVYLGMEKGGVTLSVRWSTSVSQTNGILRHECRWISIIHCILVTTMCHQWKSAARLSQNFHYSIILATRMSHQYIPHLGTEKGGVTPSVCRLTSVSHTTRNLRHVCRRFSIIDQCLSVTPPGICGTNAADFRS